jgi:hypothetical protein
VPDLLVVAGGAWAVAPGAAVGLAVADTVRRPGASQLALDHARLLGPLGTVADDGLRLAMIADLADDMLAPRRPHPGRPAAGAAPAAGRPLRGRHD